MSSGFRVVGSVFVCVSRGLGCRSQDVGVEVQGFCVKDLDLGFKEPFVCFQL